jgi:hypothetical protein
VSLLGIVSAGAWRDDLWFDDLRFNEAATIRIRQQLSLLAAAVVLVVAR